jgi:outer membrane protein assembly factor BamA
VTYRPEYYNIIDLQSDAPPYYQASTGDTLKSSLRGALTYDGRDSFMLARRGQYFELGAEGAGGPLLGSQNTWKIRAEYRVYFPIWKEQDWIPEAKRSARWRWNLRSLSGGNDRTFPHFGRSGAVGGLL